MLKEKPPWFVFHVNLPVLYMILETLQLWKFLSFGEAALSRIAEGHMLLLRLELRCQDICLPHPPSGSSLRLIRQENETKKMTPKWMQCCFTHGPPPNLSALLKEILGFSFFLWPPRASLLIPLLSSSTCRPPKDSVPFNQWFYHWVLGWL